MLRKSAVLLSVLLFHACACGIHAFLELHLRIIWRGASALIDGIADPCTAMAFHQPLID